MRSEVEKEPGAGNGAIESPVPGALGRRQWLSELEMQRRDLTDGTVA